jgi:hypothetical protein
MALGAATFLVGLVASRAVDAPRSPHRRRLDRSVRVERSTWLIAPGALLLALLALTTPVQHRRWAAGDWRKAAAVGPDRALVHIESSALVRRSSSRGWS